MNNIKYIFSAAAFMLSVGLTSCTSDLDVNPIDPNLKTKVNTKAESALTSAMPPSQWQVMEELMVIVMSMV